MGEEDSEEKVTVVGVSDGGGAYMSAGPLRGLEARVGGGGGGVAISGAVRVPAKSAFRWLPVVSVPELSVMHLSGGGGGGA